MNSDASKTSEEIEARDPQTGSPAGPVAAATPSRKPVAISSSLQNPGAESEFEILIGAGSSGFEPGLHDLWRYRELLYFLIWRDLKIRYKQTLLGAGWAIIQPLIAMMLF